MVQIQINSNKRYKSAMTRASLNSIWKAKDLSSKSSLSQSRCHGAIADMTPRIINAEIIYPRRAGRKRLKILGVWEFEI